MGEMQGFAFALRAVIAAIRKGEGHVFLGDVPGSHGFPRTLWRKGWVGIRRDVPVGTVAGARHGIKDVKKDQLPGRLAQAWKQAHGFKIRKAAEKGQRRAGVAAGTGGADQRPGWKGTGITGKESNKDEDGGQM